MAAAIPGAGAQRAILPESTIAMMEQAKSYIARFCACACARSRVELTEGPLWVESGPWLHVPSSGLPAFMTWANIPANAEKTKETPDSVKTNVMYPGY